jgi:MFS family permease
MGCAAEREVGQVQHPVEVTISATRRRALLAVLFLTQALGGAGLVAAVTAGGLAGKLVTGSTALAGLPPGCLVIGVAAGSLVLSRLMARRGRRPGLVVGYLTAAAGGGLALGAMRGHSFPLLLSAVLLLGFGNGSNLLARYAATDLAGPRWRGRVISLVVFGTSGGALLGPVVLGRLATPSSNVFDIGTLFVTATIAYGVAAVAITLGLRPDPMWVRLEASSLPPPAGGDPLSHARGNRRAALAASALPGGTALAVAGLVILNFAMVIPMSMAPVYMADAGAVVAGSTVISVHVAAMYGSSPLSGWFTDRCGRLPVMWASGAVLSFAGIVLAHAPPGSLTLMSVGLMLLGIAWNCGFISCSAILTDAAVTSPHPARLQGFADTCMNAAGAVAALISGALLRTVGFGAIGWLVGALGVLIVVIAGRETLRGHVQGWEQAPS